MNDLLVLAHLLPGPQHGYALKKQIAFLMGRRDMHNNLIYPLLRQLERKGWIAERKAEGRRGQPRAIYTLTKKGRRELLRRLEQFTYKDAASENAFRLRVGLFGFLDVHTRSRILAERDAWLAARQKHIKDLTTNVIAGHWGGEVLVAIAQQVRWERLWIARLKRRIDPRVKPKRSPWEES